MSTKVEQELIAAAEAYGDACVASFNASRSWERGDDRGELERTSRVWAATHGDLITAARKLATATRRRRRAHA